MQFDMAALASSDRYKLLASSIVPRPIAWITSQSAGGARNAAPYSFFNMMGPDPATVVLGLMARSDGTLKDTDRNILDTGEFVIHLVSQADAETMNRTCIDAPPGVDELALAQIAVVASSVVAPPRIASAPVAFECRLVQRVILGARQTLVIGEVLVAHVRDEFVIDRQRCHIDTLAMDLVGRVHGAGWYTRIRDVFQLGRPEWPGG